MMISIITPCFNSSCVIPRLINSLENQVCKNFEWIVVDDCSENADYERLKRMLGQSCLQYSFFRNKENKGAGESRNMAIANAKGKYFVFVDSDDFVEKDFVQKICDAIDYSKADIVFFDYKQVPRGKTYQTISGKEYGEINIDYTLVRVSSNVCGKVFSAKIIRDNNICFPNIKRFEDWVFGTTAISHSTKLYYIKNVLYNVVDNPQSITKNDNNAFYYAKLAFEFIKTLDVSYDIKELLFVREVLYTAIKDFCMKGNFEQKQIIESLVSDYPKWYGNKYYRLLNSKVLLFTQLYRYNLIFGIKILLKIFFKIRKRV